MAQRRGDSVAAPVKQKLRKRHGPKRHMFKDLKPMVHEYAQAGILSKYYNYESFAQCLMKKGIRSLVPMLWDEFVGLSFEQKREFFANLPAHEQKALARKEKFKKFLPKDNK